MQMWEYETGRIGRFHPSVIAWRLRWLVVPVARRSSAHSRFTQNAVRPSYASASFHPRTTAPDMSNRKIAKASPTDQGASIVSRRGFLKFAGASSLATAAGTLSSAARAANSAPDGTPEQVHLTWGNDPTHEVTVSWASLAPAVNPQVRVSGAREGKHTVHGVPSTYTDGLNREVVFTYHARLRDL